MRSRNSLMRERREAFRDARLIVIASEGKDTERIYFKALAKEYTNPRVHVHILERSVDEQNNSSPEYVLKQLNDYKSQYDLEADDELWLVVDKDRWTEAMLSRVATECSQEVAMHMALSNPCFELWLLLHIEDATSLTPEEQMRWMENRKHPIKDVYLSRWGVATFASNTKSHDDKGRGRPGDCLLRREQDQLQTAPVGTWD